MQLAPNLAGTITFLPESDAVAFDRASARTFDAEGRMHVERSNISKANVCPYYGREIPNYRALGLDGNRVYRLYRDPVELERAAPTFRNVPLLSVHAVVTARDPKPSAIAGTVGTDVTFDGTYLVAPLAVWAQDSIDLIESKKRAELSCGYRYRADMTPGVTPQGVAFDGVMRDIVGNHVALVDKGRAGSDVYVCDSTPELIPMKHAAAVAVALAALGITNATAEQQAALDGAIDSAAKQPEPVAALDEVALDAAIVAKGYVTKADAAQMAADATAAAVAHVNALHKAREDVKPLVGIVAMDSAEAVYRYALDKAGVPVDGVPPAAFAALVDQVKQGRANAAPSKPRQIAMDAANAATDAIPGLGRFNAA